MANVAHPGPHPGLFSESINQAACLQLRSPQIIRLLYQVFPTHPSKSSARQDGKWKWVRILENRLSLPRCSGILGSFLLCFFIAFPGCIVMVGVGMFFKSYEWVFSFCFSENRFLHRTLRLMQFYSFDIYKIVKEWYQ